MTHLRRVQHYPNKLSITCPNCEAEATFQFPYTLHYNPNAQQLALIVNKLSPNESIETWSNTYTVVVHFPRIYSWPPPPTYSLYGRDNWGVSSCLKCGSQKKHLLNLPQDAYYVCKVKNQYFWLFSLEHCSIFLQYINATHRRIRNYPYSKYTLSLLHIPKPFLLAKNRKVVTKQLQAYLS